MTYDHNDYLVDNDDDEYLTSILVDVNYSLLCLVQ